MAAVRPGVSGCLAWMTPDPVVVLDNGREVSFSLADLLSHPGGLAVGSGASLKVPECSLLLLGLGGGDAAVPCRV